MIMERAKENDACCLKKSISASEDGSTLRSPLVRGGGGCEGELKKLFNSGLITRHLRVAQSTATDCALKTGTML